MGMVEFDKKVICGPSYVALREVKRNTTNNMIVDGIMLANNSFSNEKLGHYVIEDIGEIAAQEYGLSVGDYVIADKLASFYHSQPVCIMTYNNIILKTNKDKSEIHPVKNKVIIKEDPSEIVNTGGIFIQTNPNTIRFGRIVELEVSPSKDLSEAVLEKGYPFTVGDHVMIPRKGDIITVGHDETYFVCNPDQIICKVLD